MAKRYRVTLEKRERAELEALLSRGKVDVRRLKHAQILLAAEDGDDRRAQTDESIAATVGCGTATVERVRKRFVEEGLELALSPYRTPRREYRPKLDGEQEARLITLACSEPPEGRVRWTLRLLADALVELEIVDSVSYETVRQTLKKTSCVRI